MSVAMTISVTETGGSSQNKWSLDGDLNGEITLDNLLQFTKGALIQIAPVALSEEQRKGFDKKPRTMVDGKLDGNIDNVKPLGKIEYLSRVVATQAILDIYNTIIMNSKVASGRYRDSNVVKFNDELIATNLGELVRWVNTHGNFTDKDTLRFINTTPYARRLEFLGVKASGPATPRTRKFEKHEKRKSKFKGSVTLYAKAPNGTYFLAFMTAKRNYKVLSDDKFKFEFLPGNMIGVVTPNGTFKTGRKRGIGKAYLYPTIVLRLSEKGMAQ
jgi:hypothetical protein